METNISEKTLREQTELKNGTTLEIYDASRTMTGDRMLVILLVRLEIPADSLKYTNAGKDLPSEDEIRAALGDPVRWEYTKQRKFIDKREKDEVLGILHADFNANMRPYVLHPDFPARYVKKQLQEQPRRSNWYK
ncbi:MAG: hypothetical protein ACLFUN_10175 [Desulfobacterales bacterium]